MGRRGGRVLPCNRQLAGTAIWGPVWEDFYDIIMFNKCVKSFQDDLVKRFYRVDT